MSELLRPREAAKYLKVSEVHLRLMRRRGDGPAWVKLTPRVIRYRIEDLELFLAGKVTNGNLQARKDLVAQISSRRS